MEQGGTRFDLEWVFIQIFNEIKITQNFTIKYIFRRSNKKQIFIEQYLATNCSAIKIVLHSSVILISVLTTFMYYR